MSGCDIEWHGWELQRSPGRRLTARRGEACRAKCGDVHIGRLASVWMPHHLDMGDFFTGITPFRFGVLVVISGSPETAEGNGQNAAVQPVRTLYFLDEAGHGVLRDYSDQSAEAKLVDALVQARILAVVLTRTRAVSRSEREHSKFPLTLGWLFGELAQTLKKAGLIVEGPFSADRFPERSLSEFVDDAFKRRLSCGGLAEKWKLAKAAIDIAGPGRQADSPS
jgi:hypothetical protein